MYDEAIYYKEALFLKQMKLRITCDQPPLALIRTKKIILKY